MMRMTFWVYAGIVLYALIVGGTLTLAAKGGSRRMWGWAGGIVLIAVAIGHVFGAVPIFYDACPLCGYGWDIHPVGFGLAALFGGLALRGTADTALPPLVRVLIPSAAAFPPLWITTGWWIS